MLFPRQPENLMLIGPSGKLEAMTTWPMDRATVTGVAIICHPHPLYQGTMHNKVVTTMMKALAKLGLATVRFNYRGVGQSEGAYGAMQGEIEDLLAVKAWVQQALPQVPIGLAGFSFGAFISARVAHQDHEIVQLLSVAPAVNHADFGQLTAIQCPWLVIQGERDEIVPIDAVIAFAKAPPSPLQLITLPETSHFFHGQLLKLQQVIEENIHKWGGGRLD